MRYLGPDEMEDVRKLRQQGRKIKDLAGQFNVSEGTIHNVLRDKTIPRRRKTVLPKAKNSFLPAGFEEEDFSKQPDNVLFQHVRIWDFIG